MVLRVIGTGFGRTGTDSMREALNLLGFGPCHHMSEVSTVPEQKRLWRALARGADPDWERLFDGYASCVDFPSAFYWRELLAAYPEAKAILTWRPADEWWASYARSIGPVMRDSADPESVGVALVREQVFGGRPLDRDHVDRRLRGARRRGARRRCRPSGCSCTGSATAGRRSAPTSASRCPPSPTRTATPRPSSRPNVARHRRRRWSPVTQRARHALTAGPEWP